MKVCIDAGHGGNEVGAVGSLSKEKDINLSVTSMLRDALLKYEVEVVMTRTLDIDVSLGKRAEIANQSQSNWFISIHCNSAASADAKGIETYCYQRGTEGEKLAQAIQKTLVQKNPDAPDRGVKTADFSVLHNTKMPAILIELLFISNPKEEKTLNDKRWQSSIANSLASTLADFLKLNRKQPEPSQPGNPPQIAKTPIMGEAQAIEEQMEGFVREVNPSAPSLAKFYLELGEKEGVRGDIAFAQAIKETGYFKFGADVEPEQNNFAGLGATGDGEGGASFSTPEEGVRAHIQHLKAYASTAPLNTQLVDPRFGLVKRGSAPNFEDLNGKWAVPGNGYGQDILGIWREILEAPVVKKHYAQDVYDKWKREGIINQEHDLNAPVTWAEYIITQERLREQEEGGE